MFSGPWVTALLWPSSILRCRCGTLGAVMWRTLPPRRRRLALLARETAGRLESGDCR